jgi:hypothetical protein
MPARHAEVSISGNFRDGGASSVQHLAREPDPRTASQSWAMGALMICAFCKHEFENAEYLAIAEYSAGASFAESSEFYTFDSYNCLANFALNQEGKLDDYPTYLEKRHHEVYQAALKVIIAYQKGEPCGSAIQDLDEILKR